MEQTQSIMNQANRSGDISGSPPPIHGSKHHLDSFDQKAQSSGKRDSSRKKASVKDSEDY